MTSVPLHVARLHYIQMFPKLQQVSRSITYRFYLYDGFNHWTNNNIPGKQNKVQTLKREANRGVSDGDYVLMNDWMRRLFKKSGWLWKSFQYLQFKEEESLLLLIWRVMSRCPYFEKKHLYVDVSWNSTETFQGLQTYELFSLSQVVQKQAADGRRGRGCCSGGS